MNNLPGNEAREFRGEEKLEMRREAQSGAGQPAGGSGGGRMYWRSLDELANTPEFRQWVEREFPEGASECTDGVSRRHFMKIMTASFLLAGAGLATSGCRRPVQTIVPLSKKPEDYVHGEPLFYATSMPGRGNAIPLVVRADDGRPTKIEGNALHPDSNGGTDRYAQASILNLYDPDRAADFKKAGNIVTPEATTDFLSQLSREAQANSGGGFCFLSERSNSPSRLRLQKVLAEKCPKARWFTYEPVDLDVHQRAASKAFGANVRPVFRYDTANVVVSLDCDFLGSEEDVHNNIRRFSQRRQLEDTQGTPNRLYVVEGLMTLTGFSGDHRLRVPTSAVAQVAGALANEVYKQAGLPALPHSGELPAGVDPAWVIECARDLLQNRGQSLVVAGYRQPLAVHLLAWAINSVLGNLGKTAVLFETPAPSTEGIAELAQALNSGQVNTLVILEGNPVYTAPADLDWAGTQRKARTVVRLGYYEDETFPHCDWHLPAAHYLEAWGDACTSDGTLVPVQPLIAPLFGGITEIELLARIAGVTAPDPYAIVRETFAGFVSGGNTDAAWPKFLHDGFLANSAAKPVDVRLDSNAIADTLRSGLQVSAPGRESLEVVFHRDYSVDDGRFSNNGWLQELPDPVTKLVWDNPVLVSHKTARELGWVNGDMIEITLGNRTVEGPVWVQPGQADYMLGLALGYGRERAGRVGHNVGFNMYPLRTTQTENFAVGAKVRKPGGTYQLATTQNHWSMEGRPIVREANLQQYREHPDFAKRMDIKESPIVQSLYPNPFDELKKKGLHQWAMSIDLNRCVGCSACMIACQSENNVPIVGKDQVARGREMHWLRMDRYYAGPPSKEPFMQTFNTDGQQQFEEWIVNPQVVTQPMLCQQCEAAPCENVCPVNATTHDQEGLNVMTYNRCVGTRYCSNNCPYKVRRFNFFDYNKRPLDKLYLGPLAKRPEDEVEMAAMVKNPQVTVRMRGVMEKCTYCIQRIEQAKIAQKIKVGASGDVVVPEGTFTTACAQACPAEAIVFGNIKDPNSRVSKLKTLDRDYHVLEALFTRPRTSYLAKVRNPNPRMPDYHEAPLSLERYEQKMGSPFEGEHETPPAPSQSGARKGAHL